MASRFGSFIACAFALGVATASAHADTAVQATATIGNFSYQLIDLAPEDGIDPWIALSPDQYYGYALLYGTSDLTPVTTSLNRFDAGTISAVSPGATAASSGLAHEGVVSLNLSANSASVYTQDRLDFVLSPNTLAVFYANADINGTFDPNAFAMSSDARLYSEVVVAPGTGVQRNTSVLANYDPIDMQAPLTIAVRSDANGLEGDIRLTASITAEALSPVPEPAEAAMLLAGLALLPAWRRRARRKAMRHD